MIDQYKQELDNINTGKTRPKTREELLQLKVRKIELLELIDELTNPEPEVIL